MKERSPSALLRLLSATLLFAFTACVKPVAQYQQARAAFSQATKIENAARTSQALPAAASPQEIGNLTAQLIHSDSLEADRSYRTALSILQSIGSSGEAELLKADLLAEKLTLEALCLWRLNKEREFQETLNRAAALADSASTQASPRSRDSYLLEALPGLMMNDQAHRIIQSNISGSPTSDFQSVQELLAGPDESALKYISRARRAAEKSKHPVAHYLVSAELATYRNLQVAHDRMRTPQTPLFHETKQFRLLQDLLRELEAHSDPTKDALLSQWLPVLGNPISR